MTSNYTKLINIAYSQGQDPLRRNGPERLLLVTYGQFPDHSEYPRSHDKHMIDVTTTNSEPVRLTTMEVTAEPLIGFVSTSPTVTIW